MGCANIKQQRPAQQVPKHSPRWQAIMRAGIPPHLLPVQAYPKPPMWKRCFNVKHVFKNNKRFEHY